MADVFDVSCFLPLFFVCGVHLSLTMSTIATKRYDLPKKGLIAVEAANIIAAFNSKKSALFAWVPILPSFAKWEPGSYFEGKQEIKRPDFCFHGNGKSVAGKVEEYERNEEITAASYRS